MKGESYKAIFISDVHLGTTACQADYLLDFLKENQCETLYLVGDIVDLIAMRRRVNFSIEHEELISVFMQKAKQGTRVVYIPGNHDALFRRFVGQTIAGVEVKKDAVHISSNGQRYYVSHGDEFDAIMQCGRWLTWIGDLSHGLLLRMNTLVNLVRRSWRLPYWSLARAVKERIGRAQDFIAQFERLSSRRALGQKFDGYICGHIHHWQMAYHGEALYMNDGDWVEHCTALVETSQGEFQLIHWADDKYILRRSSELVKPEPADATEIGLLRPDTVRSGV